MRCGHNQVNFSRRSSRLLQKMIIYAHVLRMMKTRDYQEKAEQEVNIMETTIQALTMERHSSN